MCAYGLGQQVAHLWQRDRAKLDTFAGTHKDERTVLYKTKSLDSTKPNLRYAIICFDC